MNDILSPHQPTEFMLLTTWDLCCNGIVHSTTEQCYDVLQDNLYWGKVGEPQKSGEMSSWHLQGSRNFLPTNLDCTTYSNIQTLTACHGLLQMEDFLLEILEFCEALHVEGTVGIPRVSSVAKWQGSMYEAVPLASKAQMWSAVHAIAFQISLSLLKVFFHDKERRPRDNRNLIRLSLTGGTHSTLTHMSD